MPVKVKIPSALRRFTRDAPFVETPKGNVREVLTSLVTQHESLKGHLLTDDGELRNFVNVYVNGNDVRTLQGEDTPVNEGDTVLVVPAIAGGS